MLLAIAFSSFLIPTSIAPEVDHEVTQLEVLDKVIGSQS